MDSLSENPQINKLAEFFTCVSNIVEEKCLTPIITYDILVTRNLREAGIITRPAGTNGLWCFTLLPTVLILYSLLYEVPQAYKLAACVSVGLLVYNVLFNLFISISALEWTSGAGGGCLVSGLISSILVYSFVKQDIVFVLVFALTPPSIFRILLQKLLSYSKTFTVGEAVIVAQSIAIVIIVTVAEITCDLGDEKPEVDLVHGVVITVFSTVGLIVTALNMLKDEYRTVQMLLTILAVAAVFALVQLYCIFGVTCLPRLFWFLFMDATRAKLIALWAFLLLSAVARLVYRTKMSGKANTVTRKFFHILAAAVFSSGILLDLRLMEMAAGIGLGLLILVEALRKSYIEPISPALQMAFLVYSDEKDCGEFALTPIYMYCGLGCGLLAPRDACALERLAGVLAVGVGDAAASWFGARYGRRKWHGQNRTVEGTIFNVLSQIMTVYFLGLFELMDCKNAVIRTAVASTASGLVEAKTEQVDNLILPLVTLIAFQLTHFMA